MLDILLGFLSYSSQFFLLIFVFSCFVFLFFFSNDGSLFSFAFVLLLYLRIRATGGLGHASSSLRNSRSQSSKYLALNLLYRCSKIATTRMLQQQCYNIGFNIYTVLDLFQFFSNQVLSSSLQAHCYHIPSLKFKLSVTYNYAYDLSIQFILNQNKTY